MLRNRTTGVTHVQGLAEENGTTDVGGSTKEKAARHQTKRIYLDHEQNWDSHIFTYAPAAYILCLCVIRVALAYISQQPSPFKETDSIRNSFFVVTILSAVSTGYSGMMLTILSSQNTSRVAFVHNCWSRNVVVYIVSTMAYTAMLFFGEDLVVIAPNGAPVYIARVIEWGFTVPMMRVSLFRLFQETVAIKEQQLVIMKVVAVHVLGLIAVVNAGPNLTCLTTMLVAICLFADGLIGVAKSFDNYIKSNPGPAQPIKVVL